MSGDFRLEDYRLLVDSLDVGAVLQHRDLGIVAANPAACTLLGLTMDQLLGRDSMDPRWEARREDGSPFPGEEHPAMVAMREGEVVAAVPMQIARPDGSRVWLSVTARPQFDEGSDSPSYVTVTFRDVTETVRQRREQLQHRLAFEHVGIGATIVSMRQLGRIVFCNQAYADMMRRPMDELVGMNVDDLLHPADRERMHQAASDVIEGRVPATPMEVRALRGDGQWVWVLAYATVVRDDRGQPLYGIGQAIDITDRKLADEKLNTYISQISDIIGVVDEVGTMRYISSGVRAVLGYDPDAVTGRSAFDFMAEEDQERTAVALTNTSKRPGLAPPLLVRMRAADGTLRDLELVANNRLHDPAIRGIVITARDVSERLAIEARLREQEVLFARLQARRERERLELELARAQRLESLGRLAGGIAHDFNNLLGVIINYATLLERRDDLHTQARADVEAVHRAAERGADLIRRLLQFSRRDVVAAEPVEVCGLVRDLGRLLERTLGRGIALHLDLPAIAWVEAERGRLEQVLINLVLNARDAIDGTGRIDIVVQLDDASRGPLRERGVTGSVVVVSVRDDGAGMSDDVVATAFEPFFTTKEEGEGTGLGLATVYGVVEALGGATWIESSEGEGTSVSFALPARGEPGPDDAAAPSVGTGPGRVLVVDDEVGVAETAARLLEEVGWDAVVAGDAESALHWADQGMIDIVLSDVRMPGVDGIELARTLRSRCPDLPVVLMSGHPPETARLAGLEIAAVVSKPFDVRRLDEILRAAVGR